MARQTDIETQLEANAQAAAEVTVDGTTTKEHPLTESIAADKYTRANRARRRPGSGVTFQKIVPHGAV